MQKIAWDSTWGGSAAEHSRARTREIGVSVCAPFSSGKTPIMDLLAIAKNIADRVEEQALRSKVSVAICLIDIHGNVVLKHRMSEAPVFSIDLSERKAYTSALVGMRTADLLPLVQPGQPLFPLMSQEKYCAMGGGAPLTSEGRVIAGVGVSGGTVEQDVAILEAGLREA
jgi:uncharacterized protein GlcG (DUF336 family)